MNTPPQSRHHLPSSKAERTPGNIWESYRSQFDTIHSNLNRYHRALKFAHDRLCLKIAKYATFDHLKAAGVDVRQIDDGTIGFKPKGENLPNCWVKPQNSITPKIATIQDALLNKKNGAVLLPNGFYTVYDTSFFSGDWRIMTRRGGVKFFDPKSNDVLIRRTTLCKRIHGRCFSTLSNYFNNMGHFIHDNLSRIYYEDLGAISPGQEKIIAPRMKFPMQKFLFDRIYADYEIVYTPKQFSLIVEELLLPRNLCSQNAINPAAISSLAKRMRRIAAPYVGPRKYKICISRRDGTSRGRNYINMIAFEELMRKMDYHVVEVSKLSPEEQLELWANATDIVGIHGAGMMNSLFMQPGANYTEITGAPANHILHYTARCAMIVGHNVKGLIGDIDRDGNAVINLNHLEEILK